MTDDHTEQIVDELRRRIAYPTTVLPRRDEETVERWAARAVAAGLADGSLGYVPGSSQRAQDAEQVIVRAMVDRRVEVEGPDFDQADESLIGYAKAVRAALQRAGLICDALCRDVEEDRDHLAAVVTVARTAAQRLLERERQHSGSGRDGNLREDDLAPLLEALGIGHADEPA